MWTLKPVPTCLGVLLRTEYGAVAGLLAAAEHWVWSGTGSCKAINVALPDPSLHTPYALVKILELFG